MKILLIIFSVFCFSFTNAQTIVETKSDSTISNSEWQNKIDGKLDFIIENLSNKKNIALFSKPGDPQKNKQADSLKNIIDTLQLKIIKLEKKINSSSDTISNKEKIINGLNAEKKQSDKNCKINLDTKDGEITAIKNRIAGLEQNEIASLIKEIDALKDQPFTFSFDILQSIQSRITNLDGDHQKMINNYPLFLKFKQAVVIINEANKSLEGIYSPSVEMLLTKLDDPSIIPEFIELNKKKTELKNLLGNYCSSTTEVKKYLNGSEQIPDEQTRIIYIKDNAVPEAEGYKFLEDLCKKVIKDKTQNVLREFSCQ